MNEQKASSTTVLADSASQAVDVVVIGGGLAGLLTANHVVKSGLSVTVLERGQVGGRSRTKRSSAGFQLNQGPHAMYIDQPLHRSLVEFGLDPIGSEPPTSGTRGLVVDELGLLPGGPLSLLRTNLLPWRAKPRLAALMALIGRKKPANYAHQTVDEWLDSEDLHSSIRQLIEGLVRLTTYCADHDIASADMAIQQLQLALSDGVRYINDGWQVLVDHLTEQAIEKGADIREGSTVRSIEHNRVHLDDGTTLNARSVILAGLSPGVVQTLIPNSPDLSEAAGPAIEAATLDLGIKGQPEIAFVLGLDCPLYHSRHDPPADLSPADHQLYGTMRYLRRDEEHDREVVRDQLLSLAKTAGIAAGDIVEDRYSHRLTVTHGMPLARNGGLAGRPGAKALALDGVFLAGDWIGPEGVLADASAASARVAAQAAVAHVAATIVGP